jgi:DNA-binding NarL/FixJ family response regulator
MKKEDQPENTAEHSPVSREMRTMLVAENSPFEHATTGLLERQAELQVVGIAHGYRQALEQATTLHPQVVLLDLDLPGRTALETITRLRGLLPSAVIIALSLIRGKPYRHVAISAGANELVQKFNINTELMPAIRQAALSLSQDLAIDQPDKASNTT